MRKKQTERTASQDDAGVSDVIEDRREVQRGAVAHRLAQVTVRAIEDVAGDALAQVRAGENGGRRPHRGTVEKNRASRPLLL
ncbi:hypothetical protein AYO44_15550 [Planctomycetaceae bacterium SCGC AG-212-F19]|nr:hypothetical protein AYO44_15550 [Planctomycetaceae bacterium SCGC AG-212-F19]